MVSWCNCTMACLAIIISLWQQRCIKSLACIYEIFLCSFFFCFFYLILFLSPLNNVLHRFREKRMSCYHCMPGEASSQKKSMELGCRNKSVAVNFQQNPEN